MHVVYAVQDAITLKLYQNASHHYAGKGIEQGGLAWEHTTFLIRKHRKEGEHARSAGLESLLAAACWSPSRTAAAYPQLPVEICACGEVNAVTYTNTGIVPSYSNQTNQMLLPLTSTYILVIMRSGLFLVCGLGGCCRIS